MSQNVMSEGGAPEPEVGLKHLPTREDILAVQQAATWQCECPPLMSRLFGEIYSSYFARHACKGCRARRALSDLVAVSESL